MCGEKARKEIVMTSTKDIMLTENTVNEAIESIHTCGIPEMVRNQMSAYTSQQLTNALNDLLNGNIEWAMLYNSCRTIEGTTLNTWRLTTSKTVNDANSEVMFESLFHKEIVFFERQPRLQEKAGIRVSAYSQGGAGYAPNIVEKLTTTTITICNTVDGVRETFGIRTRKLDDILDEVVRRLWEDPTAEAYIIAVMPSSKEERHEHGSRWTILVLPKDALTAHGSSRVNRLHRWDVPKGSKVAVIGAAKKLEERDPSLAFQPEDLRVQFYYDWQSMRDDPDVGTLVSNYRSSISGTDEDERALLIRSEPFSEKMAAFHQKEFGTTRLLYTEAALNDYREHGRVDLPVIRLHDISGKKNFFWLRMRGYDGFELSGSYEGGVIFASSDESASLSTICNSIDKTVGKLKSTKEERRESRDDEAADTRMIKSIFRAMAHSVISEAAQTMGCTPVINSDVMDDFIAYAYKCVQMHNIEVEEEKRRLRSATIGGRIRNMF